MAKRRRRIWLYGRGDDMCCCLGRPNTCNNLSLLDASESDFYPHSLHQATVQLNGIFDQLNEQAPPGTHLALIDTSVGVMLVYAKAIDRPPDLSGYVTAESDEDDIRETLGLGPAQVAA